MQNTIENMRLQTTGMEKTLGSASKRRDGADVVLADPFLAIIMNIISSQQEASGMTDGGLAQQGQSVEGLLQLLQTQPLTGGDEQSTGLIGLLPLLQSRQSVVQLFGTPSDQSQSALLDGMSQMSYAELLNQVVGQISESGEAPNADTMLYMMMQGSSQLEGETQTGSNAQLLAALANMQGGREAQSASAESLRSAISEAVQTGNTASAETVISAASLEQSEGGADQTAKDSFASAVEKAKELIAKQGEKSKTELTEGAEATAAQTSEVKTQTPFELRFKTAEGTRDIPVADQISTGIKENLSLGKSEFTVKLNPESLGEITVKLVEEAGKTTLTITTASAQTARLINSDMEALKAAVAPMNVQVNEAVTQSEASQGGAMQQFDMAGQFTQQQFAQQQFSAQQSFMQMTRGFREASAEAYELDPALVAVSAVSTGRIDTYI